MRAGGAAVSTADIAGLTALIGYRAQFRLSWMATRLHLFHAVVPVTGTVTGSYLEQFTDVALDYTMAQKGQWRGLQSGVAVIPTLVGDRIDPDAVAFATRKLMRKFAAFAWPTAVDLSTGEVHSHQGRVAIGSVYSGYLRQQIHSALPSPTSSPAS